MFLQAARFRKTFSTLPAVVAATSFRAMVSEFVKGSRKTVPALNAKIRSIFTLAEPVSRQQSGCPESPPTLGAVVGLQPAVYPLMLNEHRVMLETFITLGAFMDP